MLKAWTLRLSAGAVYRLGTVLVWLGVLAWAPFIFLRVLGGANVRRLVRIWPTATSLGLQCYIPQVNPLTV
jgi:hypothetical protein